MGEVNQHAKKKRIGVRSGVPRRVREMSREVLQATLTKKKECNSKALQIVEQLLETTVEEAWFLENLKYIDESHYQDIVEERAITKLCGYPLCCQNLKNVPNQQFRISTKLNKVYDITERKNFCSNQCYKAGKYIKDQLLTSPLWLRDKEETPHFAVLPVDISGCGAGEEVDLGHSDTLKAQVAQLKKKDQFTSVVQFAEASLSELSKKTDKCDGNEQKQTKSPQEKQSKFDSKLEENNDSLQGFEDPIETIGRESSPVLQDKDTYSTSNIINSNSSKAGITATDSITDMLSAVSLGDNPTQKDVKSCAKSAENSKQNSQPTFEQNCHKTTESNVPLICNNSDRSQKESTPKENTKSKKSGRRKESKSSTDIPPMINTVIHIEKCLNEWFTIESMCFLFGEAKVKEMVSDKGESLKEYYKAASSAVWDQAMQRRYAAICRRLDLAEIREEMKTEPLQPVPNYSMLQAQGRMLELKVQSFFEGKTTFGNIDTQDAAEQQTEDNSSSVANMPLVDLHAQKALRRRIVLDRLNRVVPDLLRTFGWNSQDVIGSVRLLVNSFSLGAQNITFKPAEWSLLGLIIIKMLSIKDNRLKFLLDSEQAKKYLTMMLMGFQLDGIYLDRLMSWLTDIDNLLHKQS